jgi:hypothetical protein
MQLGLPIRRLDVRSRVPHREDSFALRSADMTTSSPLRMDDKTVCSADIKAGTEVSSPSLGRLLRGPLCRYDNSPSPLRGTPKRVRASEPLWIGATAWVTSTLFQHRLSTEVSIDGIIARFGLRSPWKAEAKRTHHRTPSAGISCPDHRTPRLLSLSKNRISRRQPAGAVVLSWFRATLQAISTNHPCATTKPHPEQPPHFVDKSGRVLRVMRKPRSRTVPSSTAGCLTIPLHVKSQRRLPSSRNRVSKPPTSNRSRSSIASDHSPHRTDVCHKKTPVASRPLKTSCHPTSDVDFNTLDFRDAPRDTPKTA